MNYDKTTGEFSGDITVTVGQYLKVNGIKAHRLAWQMVHGYLPTTPVTFKDGNRLNCAIDNLYFPPEKEKPKKKAKKKRPKNYYFHAASGLWMVYKNYNGKRHTIGYYESEVEAYRKAQSL